MKSARLAANLVCLAIRIIAKPENQAELPRDPVEDDIRAFINSRARSIGKDVLAHVLPVRSVGVGGDERSHISVVALDNIGPASDELAELAREIPANFRGKVNRVIYALGSQALSERTVTKTLLDGEPRAQLRQADKIVFEAMRSFNVLGKIKQMPVVLLPLSFRNPGERSLVLRPVTTSTFMTVQAMLPDRDLPREFFDNITERVLGEVAGISQVFLDLTNKPPGTTEWE